MSTPDRLSLIRLATWTGIIGNGILAFLKILFGFYSHSLAVVGDGIDSTTDILSFLIILFATRIISKSPDKNHPYGHHRAEPLATIIISFIIFFVGAQLLQTSLTRLFNKEMITIPSIVAVYITLISIAGKIFLTFVQFKIGKKTSSSMLIANSKNMLNDILISSGVLLGLFLTIRYQVPWIDPLIAILVSFWVLRIAIKIFIATNTELMEGIEDLSVYDNIFEAVKKVKGALNPHRTRIRKLANLYVIDIDIEVNETMSVAEGHEIAVNVERVIKQTVDNVYDISVHVEPLGNFEKHEKYGVSGDTEGGS